MKKLVQVIGLFLCVGYGYSQSFNISGVTYEIITTASSNEVKITDYTASSGANVVIPSAVVYPVNGRKYAVTEVANDAFKQKGLTSVSLAKTIRKIGTWAFAFNQLTSVILPDSIQTVGGSSFRGNAITSIDFGSSSSIVLGNFSFGGNQMTNLVLSSNLTSISNNVFSDNNITTITFENGVGTVAVGAFYGNPLTKVICNSTVPATIVTNFNNSDTYYLTVGQVSGRANIDLVIPVGTMGVYVTDPGALWTGFKSVTEDALITNIENPENLQELSIYPNPVQSILTLDSKYAVSEVELFSLNGISLDTEAMVNNTLDVSELDKGIYILKIKAENKLYTQKFTKQ